MASLNKVMLIGNLGRDPEVRYMLSGDAMATVTLATTDNWKDKASGEKQERTEWHRVVFFGRQAEVVSQYLKKGSSIYVEGSLTTRKWADKDGNERYTTEIRADKMQMLGGRGGNAGPNIESVDDGYGEPAMPASPRPVPQQARPAAPRPAAAPKPTEIFEDDIPF